ncbi:MAG: UDP-N-acetylmuramate dehydrogenase [Lachnospiraceae bacterium]|nr:UDP-N-acetylmuramate dehydrogenase [Lachnospiraceae bacterium]
MNINNIRKITRGEILRSEPMSAHTSFRVGGPADYYIIPKNARETAALIRYHRTNGLPYYVIGNGSNLLVSDAGYRGTVIDLGRNDGTAFTMLGYEWAGDELLMDAGAGCTLASVGSFAAKFGGTGFESLTGIPGCIGGACIMNAGAFEREMKDVIRSVEVITKEGELKTLQADEIEFRYRGSSLMDEGCIVTRAEIGLQKGDPEQIRARCEELAATRKAKQPLEYPSAGSTFKRPAGYFAGKLISDAGLKGYHVGDAEVSEKHAGFIINKGRATASDIAALIRHVQDVVFKEYGVMLEPEVRFLGSFDA